MSVKDSGIGIDLKEVSTLFQPFVQADNSTARRFGGTGLGLSICKRFAEVMNGEIGVDSVFGDGSTFWIVIELGVSKLKSLNGSPFPKSKLSLSEIKLEQKEIAHRKTIRILIAEDNRMNQLIIMNMMDILGYTATLAGNGEDAVKIYSDSNYSLHCDGYSRSTKESVQRPYGRFSIKTFIVRSARRHVDEMVRVDTEEILTLLFFNY